MIDVAQDFDLAVLDQIWDGIGTKEFNPDQPRDEQGRFASGGAGGGSGIDSLVAGWSTGNNWGDLQHAARAVIAGTSSDGYICNDCEGDDKERYKAAQSLLSAINDGPEVGKPLYRGLTSGGDFKVGDTFSESLTSWTGKKELAAEFAAGKYNPRAPWEHGSAAVLHVATSDNSKGIDVSSKLPADASDTHKSADEWLTSGRYEVVSVSESGGVKEVAVKRIGNAVKQDIKKEFNPDQPRDEHGRWTSGGDSGNSGEDSTSEQPKADDGGGNAQLTKPSAAYTPINPDGKSTEEKYKDASGWTQERQQLHKAIVAKHASGAVKSDNPTVHLTGGGPASGKSTIVHKGLADLPEHPVHIDVDGIKADIPEYQEMVAAGDTKAAAFVHEESSAVSKDLLRHATSNGFDAVLDSTGDSSYEKLAGKIAEMRAAGHRVVGHYVTVDTEVAVERANARAAKTGRFVPESVIRETHAAVSRVLPRAMEMNLFDEVTLWDNNLQEPRKVASASGGTMTIHDNLLWEAFVAKGPHGSPDW